MQEQTFNESAGDVYTSQHLSLSRGAPCAWYKCVGVGILCLESVRVRLRVRALVALRFVAVARDVARLAAHVAGLGAVGAVARDVAGLVARVAGLAGALAAALGAVARDVPRLVAVVARRLVGTLRALTRYVSRAVASASISRHSRSVTTNRGGRTHLL